MRLHQHQIVEMSVYCMDLFADLQGVYLANWPNWPIDPDLYQPSEIVNFFDPH